MKEILIKYIEAYADAKASGNQVLICYVVERLNEIFSEVFDDPDSK